MGYYTQFEIGTDSSEFPTPDQEVEFLQALQEITPGYARGFASGGSSDGAFAQSDDSMKWYDHNKDMNSLSVKFPAVKFFLHGEGEEAGDLWRSYHLNGRSHTVKPTFTWPPFSGIEHLLQ